MRRGRAEARPLRSLAMLSFAGNQDHIGPDVSPIAASTPVRSSLGDAHVSMSHLEISLAREECKAIKTKIPTGAC
jgi:hypothetical protein